MKRAVCAKGALLLFSLATLSAGVQEQRRSSQESGQGAEVTLPSRPATPFFKGEQGKQPKVFVQDSYTPTAGSTSLEGNAASERAHTD